MGPPAKPRKPKAPTLSAAAWLPYKDKIIELHVRDHRPLHEVKEIMETDYGFKAEVRQYRFRISQWGLDRKIKPGEMKAIVRRRQRRRLVETDKPDLAFSVRGENVDPQKIDRYMKRNGISQDTLYSPASLAGRYIEAEKLLRQTLDRTQMVLGTQHPDTLTSMYRLARVFSDQGKYDEAEQLQRQTMELMQKLLGVEHPDTLESMSYLAMVFLRQGKYDEAEQLQQQTMELMQKILGVEHPDTLESMSYLAAVFSEQGKYDEAEQLQRQTTKLMQKLLGVEHPDTLESMSYLAMVFLRQGKYDEAEQLQQQTIELGQKILGVEHPREIRRGRTATAADDEADAKDTWRRAS
ncbi:hypothetical protein MFIFM68171_00657 [Madurella fahalii]|uniref:Clr5 domain-containing protein n=1 Tax=Madurella fahalii TaxID=1157608 RepID=A0ABQ0FY58_9PEZI